MLSVYIKHLVQQDLKKERKKNSSSRTIPTNDPFPFPWSTTAVPKYAKHIGYVLRRPGFMFCHTGTQHSMVIFLEYPCFIDQYSILCCMANMFRTQVLISLLCVVLKGWYLVFWDYCIGIGSWSCTLFKVSPNEGICLFIWQQLHNVNIDAILWLIFYFLSPAIGPFNDHTECPSWTWLWPR